MELWIDDFHFHLHLSLQDWWFPMIQDNILCHSSNSIFLIWGNMNTRCERLIKKSVSDEGSFLKKAVPICFNKSRLKIIIFLKLRETSIEENFDEREDENWYRIFCSWGMNIIFWASLLILQLSIKKFSWEKFFFPHSEG